MKHEFIQTGDFFSKDGPARKSSQNYCNIKVCFTATDKDFLINLLNELVELNDCYFVKYSNKPRDGMYLGRCFFSNSKRVGEIWKKYKPHPKVFCSVQDDDFIKEFR